MDEKIKNAFSELSRITSDMLKFGSDHKRYQWYENIDQLMSNPEAIHLVNDINEVISEELLIDNFIPMELLYKPIVAEKSESENTNKPRFIIFNKNEYTDAFAKKDSIKRNIHSKIKQAKSRIGSDRSKANRISKRLERIEANLPNELLKDGRNNFIGQIFDELKLIRSIVDEINERTKTLECKEINELVSTSKKKWNATLKEAAGIVINNYRQDQLLPPDKKKYKYLLDASNEFFNTHEFPDKPNLDAEGFYENVKQYK